MADWLRTYRGYLTLALAEALILGALWLWRRPRPAPIAISEPTLRPTPTVGLIVVHVTGAVRRPDVYPLPENSRLKDALAAAGGARSDADVEALNLALPLHDGQQVRIPAQGEAAPLLPAEASAPPAAAAALINVNTATPAELESLPGIGPALAQRIIQDRQANGPYETVDQLTRVRGIGPATLEKLRPLVCVR